MAFNKPQSGKSSFSAGRQWERECNISNIVQFWLQTRVAEQFMQLKFFVFQLLSLQTCNDRIMITDSFGARVGPTCQSTVVLWPDGKTIGKPRQASIGSRRTYPSPPTCTKSHRIWRNCRTAPAKAGGCLSTLQPPPLVAPLCPSNLSHFLVVP